jgi:hypothetical protein
MSDVRGPHQMGVIAACGPLPAVCRSMTYRELRLSPHRARQFYRIESLHPLWHPVTPAVFREAIKTQSRCITEEPTLKRQTKPGTFCCRVSCNRNSSCLPCAAALCPFYFLTKDFSFLLAPTSRRCLTLGVRGLCSHRCLLFAYVCSL